MRHLTARRTRATRNAKKKKRKKREKSTAANRRDSRHRCARQTMVHRARAQARDSEPSSSQAISFSFFRATHLRLCTLTAKPLLRPEQKTSFFRIFPISVPCEISFVFLARTCSCRIFPAPIIGPRSSDAFLCVVVLRINALPFLVAKAHHGLVRIQQRRGKCVAPVNTQPRARNLQSKICSWCSQQHQILHTTLHPRVPDVALEPEVGHSQK